MRKEPMKIGDLLKKYNLLVLLIVFIVIASILSPNFLTVGNVLNLLQQASIPGIVAIGMTLVIIISGIDLSVGSVAAFAGRRECGAGERCRHAARLRPRRTADAPRA